MLGEGVPKAVIWAQETQGHNKSSNRGKLEREQARGTVQVQKRETLGRY